MKRTLVFSTFLLAAVAFAQDTRRGGWRTLGEDEQGQAGPPPPPPQAQAQYAPAPGTLTLPAGTYIRVRTNEFLSSDQNKPGDSFSVTLTEPLIAQGFVIARRGQTLGGHIASIEKAGRIKGTSKLALEITDLTLVDGQQVPIRSELFQFSGGTSNGRDAGAIIASSGVGAIIGGAVDGAGAAGIGAAAGAAAATIGVLTTRGRAAVVYPEDTMTFRTLQPIPINTENSQQAFQPVRQLDYEQNARAPRPPVRQARPAYGPPVYGPYYGYPYPYGYPYGYYGYGPTIVFGGRFGGGRYGRRW